ncbi:hypothetical protein MD484_g4340, partial [Candolleomyces efflorescens]
MPRKSALDRIRRKGDVVLKANELLPDDIVIPIMGQTGAGKSTFVNNVLQRPVATVSDAFQSCTDHLAHYTMPIPAHWATRYQLEAHCRVVLLDTPGFDDTEMSDSEILRRIAVWLVASYGFKMKVAGIVYIHPIYPGRMTQNDCSNVKVFHKICGDEGLSKVILATTKWNLCPEATGAGREKELVETFWTNLLRNSQGAEAKAKMMRLYDNADSARSIIKAILEKMAQSKIDGTEAAKQLRSKLEELLHETELSSSQDRRERLGSLVQQIGELKISLGTRIKMMLGLD